MYKKCAYCSNLPISTSDFSRLLHTIAISPGAMQHIHDIGDNDGHILSNLYVRKCAEMHINALLLHYCMCFNMVKHYIPGASFLELTRMVKKRCILHKYHVLATSFIRFRNVVYNGVLNIIQKLRFGR